MELRQIRYFVAVAEVENFRRAAERLHLAQPSLSRQIKQLESRLGVALFERVKRRVRLTPAGRELLVDARRILAQVHDLQTRARELGALPTELLHISYSDTAAWAGTVPAALRGFRQANPDVQLDLVAAEYPAQLKVLDAGDVDAAFLYGPPPNETEFESHVVNDEGVVLALSHLNRLVNEPRLRLRDLAGTPFILTARTRNSHYYESMMRACVNGGLVPRIVYEAENRATMLSLVAADLGVGFMLASARNCHSEVAFKAVDDMQIRLELKLVWRRRNASRALGRFIEVVKDMSGRAARPAPPVLVAC